MLWCAYPDGLAALSDSGGGGDDALEGRQNENEEKAAFQAHSVIGRLRLCKSPSPPLSLLSYAARAISPFSLPLLLGFSEKTFIDAF